MQGFVSCVSELAVLAGEARLEVAGAMAMRGRTFVFPFSAFILRRDGKSVDA
jgi:hypothetical protein